MTSNIPAILAAGLEIPESAIGEAIDLGPAFEPTPDLELFFAVVAPVEATPGATLQFILQTAADPSFLAPLLAYRSTPYIQDDLAMGKEVLRIPLPSNVERYVRPRYVVNGTIVSGAFNAGICPAGL